MRISIGTIYDIKNFVKGTIAESAPIIPFSAQKKYNIEIICEFIIKYFGQTERVQATPKMNIIRSFDVNNQVAKFLLFAVVF